MCRPAAAGPANGPAPRAPRPDRSAAAYLRGRRALVGARMASAHPSRHEDLSARAAPAEDRRPTGGRKLIETAIRLTAGVALILANGFFVTTEFALTRLRQFSRQELEGSDRLARAWEMTERLEIYLTGCQLGITASSILLGVVAEPAITRLIEAAVGVVGLSAGARHALSITAAVVLINLIHKIWGEQAPTYLGVERPLEVLERLSPVLWWWTKVMRPVILLGDGIAKATLGLFGVEISRSWLEAEEDEGPITSYLELRQRLRGLLRRGEHLDGEREREVLRALEIQDIAVREVMVPRGEVVSLSTERPLEENLRTVADLRYLRFPLVGESLDDVRGTVYLTSVFAALDELRAGRTTLAEIAVEPVLVDADLPVSGAIDRFQEERQELAFVMDGGRVAGILTSTDALETIAGELRDPFD